MQRLQEKYIKEITPALKKKFGYKNVMQVPKIVKVVVNAGFGKVKEDKKKIDEWANEAGKNGTDASFEADIDFMTKVVSGGLNKQKSTGQTTVPVMAGQKSRMGVDGLGSPMKESTDLLKDFMKLSGL